MQVSPIGSDSSDSELSGMTDDSDHLSEQGCIVLYLSCLKQLLARCPECEEKLNKEDLNMWYIGSALSIQIQ